MKSARRESGARRRRRSAERDEKNNFCGVCCGNRRAVGRELQGRRGVVGRTGRRAGLEPVNELVVGRCADRGCDGLLPAGQQELLFRGDAAWFVHGNDHFVELLQPGRKRIRYQVLHSDPEARWGGGGSVDGIRQWRPGGDGRVGRTVVTPVHGTDRRSQGNDIRGALDVSDECLAGRCWAARSLLAFAIEAGCGVRRRNRVAVGRSDMHVIVSVYGTCAGVGQRPDADT